ncbi:GntR-family transcription regulator [Corynebacterium kutscheri]|uniref:GntR-family transcription regulator n=1 Tax=Corynebacterium kutscheri TaxID=35755 RepID=A0A0F6TE21_9CORY|nr:GntR family transcriptional regulator [Corynebacterium kutscheri]AKE42179.1 putative transcriptional regulator [Corynebacterium kutscheri]VEH05818.1 GntR-family transcription regulator [Corynebacterium kutscheri]VEH10522.1 GntR-family transcription regulator [Corynebacterium kutscheri]VEH81711.1 GntR-family transcription regulator [Corynebacterium kutscheri]
MDDQAAPLFRQIATLIEDSIVEGGLVTGSRAPSTNELAAFHSINPATARKGLSVLVAEGILEKHRGVGMFVTEEAKELILARRREHFAAHYLAPLIDEAVKLDVDRKQLHELVDKVAESRGLYR